MIGSRHIVIALLVASVCVGSAGIAFAQQSRSPFNPNGVKLQFNNTAATATTTTHSGTIKVTFNIQIKSAAIPTTVPIYCEADVSASDANYVSSYSETAVATASRNGSTATCTVNIPYQWLMETGGGYSVGYYVSALPKDVTSYLLGLRSTSHQAMSGVPFPANGQVTPYTFNIVL